jgi:hypothetical protein
VEELLTVDEVARILKVSKAWVRQHAAGEDGRALRPNPIPCLRTGKILRFRRIDIEIWISKKMGGGKAA